MGVRYDWVTGTVGRKIHTKLQTAPSTRVLPPSARVRVRVRVRIRVTGFVLSLWILSVILQAGLMHDDAVYAEKPAVMVCFVNGQMRSSKTRWRTAEVFLANHRDVLGAVCSFM